MRPEETSAAAELCLHATSSAEPASVAVLEDVVGMDSLFDNHPRYRTIVTFRQPDYRKHVRVLYGTPGPQGKDRLGLAGHADLVAVAEKPVIVEPPQQSTATHTHTPSKETQEHVLWRWAEIDNIAALAQHPHHTHAGAVKTEAESEENVYYVDGRRYHSLRRAPTNNHVWAVLVLEEDLDETTTEPVEHTATVSHQLLVAPEQLHHQQKQQKAL